jgi:hypothetical protein
MYACEFILNESTFKHCFSPPSCGQSLIRAAIDLFVKMLVISCLFSALVVSKVETTIAPVAAMVVTNNAVSTGNSHENQALLEFASQQQLAQCSMQSTGYNSCMAAHHDDMNRCLPYLEALFACTRQ